MAKAAERFAVGLDLFPTFFQEGHAAIKELVMRSVINVRFWLKFS
jgi:hypothetical protein